MSGNLWIGIIGILFEVRNLSVDNAARVLVCVEINQWRARALRVCLHRWSTSMCMYTHMKRRYVCVCSLAWNFKSRETRESARRTAFDPLYFWLVRYRTNPLKQPGFFILRCKSKFINLKVCAYACICMYTYMYALYAHIYMGKSTVLLTFENFFFILFIFFNSFIHLRIVPC